MSTLVITSVISLVLGLASMWAANSFLTQRVALVGSFVGLAKSLNPGIAFSIRFPPYIQELVILAALVGVVLYATHSSKNTLNQIGFGLIVGGALGNIVDRLMDGTVTDYFQVGTFPVFNTPDSFITIGVGLLLLELLLERKRAGKTV